MRHRRRRILVAIAVAACLSTVHAQHAFVASGAAPKGDPVDVASRIIKSRVPDCKRVSAAKRLSDGSIRATCDGTDYRVFTMYSAAEGKTIELVLNCTDAKGHSTGGC